MFFNWLPTALHLAWSLSHKFRWASYSFRLFLHLSFWRNLVRIVFSLNLAKAFLIQQTVVNRASLCIWDVLGIRMRNQLRFEGTILNFTHTHCLSEQLNFLLPTQIPHLLPIIHWYSSASFLFKCLFITESFSSNLFNSIYMFIFRILNLVVNFLVQILSKCLQGVNWAHTLLRLITRFIYRHFLKTIWTARFVYLFAHIWTLPVLLIVGLFMDKLDFF